MFLLVITGFLGTGKTTFMVKLAGKAMSEGLKVALVVNEIGEIGIDDKFMTQCGFNVWEVLGGCICCTLAGELVQTLDNLSEEYSPDVVIVEPSGAADPRTLVHALALSSRPYLKTRRHIALLDPLRMDMLMEVLEPLVISAVQQADLVLINKADVASAQEIERTRQIASQANPQARIFVMCAKDDLDRDLWSEIRSCLT